MLTSIPEPRRDAVRQALQASFGVDAPDSLEKVTSGLSGALVYRAVVSGQPWLLRVETAAPSAFADPHRHYTSLQRAAAAGVAPAVRYADPQTRVAICDFIAAQPLSSYPGGPPAIALELAQLIARLQTTPVFGQLTDYLEGVDGILANLMSLGVVTEAAVGRQLDAYREVRDAYPRTQAGELVSSHNDINPSNILYDGRRLWLIDWEAAFANDRHVDPATIGAWFALPDEVEVALLRTVFGEVDEAIRARHFLVRQIVRTFIAAMMLTVTALSRGGTQPPITCLTGPGLSEVREAWRAELARARSSTLEAPSWLWSSVVTLLGIHEAAYLEYCRRFALAQAA